MVDSLSLSTEHEKLKESLLKFLWTHETLIDYFCIIGFENAQLRRVHHELLVEVSRLLPGFAPWRA